MNDDDDMTNVHKILQSTNDNVSNRVSDIAPKPSTQKAPSVQ